MKKRHPLLIAGLFGFLSLFLAWGYLKIRELRFHSLEEPVEVLVAARDILEGVLLNETFFEKAKIPRRFLQPQVLPDIETVLNKITVVPILKGEQVTATKLISLGIKSGLGPRIPSGFRALSIEVDEVSGVAGLIHPNNFVDLLATFEGTTATLAQRVLVLAVDQNFTLQLPAKSSKQETRKDIFSSEGGEPWMRQRKKTVTLALTPPQAQQIELAKAHGRLALILRPQQEEDVRDLSPVTIEEIAGRGEIIRETKYREYP